MRPGLRLLAYSLGTVQSQVNCLFNQEKPRIETNRKTIFFRHVLCVMLATGKFGVASCGRATQQVLKMIELIFMLTVVAKQLSFRHPSWDRLGLCSHCTG